MRRNVTSATGENATVAVPPPTVASTGGSDSAAVEPTRASSPRPPVGRRVSGWMFAAVPTGRVAAFRTVVYLFVALDPLWFTPWVRSHAAIPGVFYQPLFVGRLLHLPTPTPLLVNVIFFTLVPVAVAAATGRAPRLLGWIVFALYFEWMIIAMSYGKVDHDRFGLLVALAVLPTAGPARHGGTRMTERGGWALRMTQVAVIATYFLSSWAKLRFGGVGWLTSATLERALIRRGTPLTDLLTSTRWPLLLAQFGIVAFELSSPVVFFVRSRLRYWLVGYFYLFHLMVMLTITISFAPHQVAMTSFLPLERVRPIVWIRRFLRRLSYALHRRTTEPRPHDEAWPPASSPAVVDGHR